MIENETKVRVEIYHSRWKRLPVIAFFFSLCMTLAVGCVFVAFSADIPSFDFFFSLFAIPIFGALVGLAIHPQFHRKPILVLEDSGLAIDCRPMRKRLFFPWRAVKSVDVGRFDYGVWNFAKYLRIDTWEDPAERRLPWWRRRFPWITLPAKFRGMKPAAVKALIEERLETQRARTRAEQGMNDPSSTKRWLLRK